MTTVRLKGLEKSTKRLKGRTLVYWYAWRGGPRLTGEPGSPSSEAINMTLTAQELIEAELEIRRTEHSGDRYRRGLRPPENLTSHG